MAYLVSVLSICLFQGPLIFWIFSDSKQPACMPQVCHHGPIRYNALDSQLTPHPRSDSQLTPHPRSKRQQGLEPVSEPTSNYAANITVLLPWPPKLGVEKGKAFILLVLVSQHLFQKRSWNLQASLSDLIARQRALLTQYPPPQWCNLNQVLQSLPTELELLLDIQPTFLLCRGFTWTYHSACWGEWSETCRKQKSTV